MLFDKTDVHLIFGILAGVISALSIAVYVVSILKGKTKPNRASWIIWSVTNIILLASYFSVGARATIFLPITYVFSALITLSLSFRYGVLKWSKLDYFSLIIAGLSLIIWFITNNPLTALLMNLTMDAFAYLPTLKKSFIDPSSESSTSWFLIFIGSVFNILAVEFFSFKILIYPIVMLVMNGAVVMVLYYKKMLSSNYEK
jgi:hypothetical protein